MVNVVIDVTEQPIEVDVNIVQQVDNVSIEIVEGGGGADPATQAEVNAGIITDKYVSPATFDGAQKWNTKENTISQGTIAQYYRGDKTFQTLDKSAVGLGNVDNTSDANKPISSATQTALNGKENTIAPGTTGQYWRGDKTWQNFPVTGIPGGTASGTNTYALTIAGITAYNVNDAYVVRFTNANTGACSLNINGLGAINIVKNNVVPIIGGDIAAGQQFIAIYDGTNFQLIGVAPNQMFAFVSNADSVTITKGQVVYAFGAQGDRMSVKLANNSGDATSAKTIGLVFSSSIAPNGTGYIITQGVIDGLNLGAFNPGDTLYLSSTNGQYTATKPYAPNHLVYVGIVERANAGNGQIYVRVQNGYEMDELHDVAAQNPNPNDGLFYNSVTGLWTARAGTKSDVGLGNVDNTSDANKPVSSATQTALNAKEDTITTLSIAKGGTNSNVALNNNRIIRSSGGAIGEAAAITGSRALKSDANGIPTHFDTATEPSLTELTYVKGVTSAIQTQINAKENTITAGGTLQYFRGDKTFQNYLIVATDGTLYTNTGNTNLNRVLSILIPANTYTANSIVHFRILSTKTLSNGSYSVRTYIHTSAGVGGTQMSLSSSSAATQLVMGLERTFQVQVANGTGNGTRGLTGTQNALTEMSAAAWTVQTSVIDWTQTQYLNIFLQNGSALDTSAINAVVLYRF